MRPSFQGIGALFHYFILIKLYHTKRQDISCRNGGIRSCLVDVAPGFIVFHVFTALLEFDASETKNHHRCDIFANTNNSFSDYKASDNWNKGRSARLLKHMTAIFCPRSEVPTRRIGFRSLVVPKMLSFLQVPRLVLSLPRDIYQPHRPRDAIHRSTVRHFDGLFLAPCHQVHFATPTLIRRTAGRQRFDTRASISTTARRTAAVMTKQCSYTRSIPWKRVR